MSVPVFCAHCGARQLDENCQWSVGPESMRLSWTCEGCGWLVEARANTVHFMLRQMEASATDD